jgi:hypothetical protein
MSMANFCERHQTFSCRCSVDTDIPIMSFEAFQATRQRCDDLAEHFNCGTFEDGDQGYTYLDGALWIQDNDGEPYYLLLERSDYKDTDLEKLERLLYQYAVDGAYIIADEPPTVVPVVAAELADGTLNCLILTYQAFQIEEGITLGSSDEHHYDETLTEEQRRFCRAFSALWEIVEGRDNG